MKKLSILLLIAVQFYGCGNSDEKKNDTVDDVIHDISNWDRFVIPLGAPYEIINNQQEKNTWLINMYDKRKRFQFSITPVEKVAVNGDNVLVKGGGMYGKTSFYGKLTENIFFVISHKSKTEVGFDDSLKFNAYFDSLKIRNIQWFEVNALHKYYQINKKLPWEK